MSLIRRSTTHRFIMEKWARMHPDRPIVGISKRAMERIEAHVRQYITSLIAGHHSKGKLFDP